MYSNDVAISVSGLSKRFNMYEKAQDRLLQMFLPSLKTHKEFWALNDINFEIARGESVGIIGKNGSGKSTLLQIICGTLTPTSGTVNVNGRIAALLELGSGFNPDFSGRENVYLNCAIHGLNRQQTDELMDDILSFADIGTFIDQPVKTYSSGMFVRLAFSVQANLKPDILIVDEALAVGDALFQKRCYERIEMLTSSGTTLLFVSHDEESVRTLTQRAIFLSNGRVQSAGPSAEVILDYRRDLHAQESAYLAHLTKVVSNKTQAAPSVKGKAPDKFSFGNFDAEVISVKVLDTDGAEKQVFYPTETAVLRVECVSHSDLSNLNVGIRLRNKEGVKIYSWGTLNQDMSIDANLCEGEYFWGKSFSAGETFIVDFEFVCSLGVNLYEVQAAISHEGKPYYAEQRIIHWRDEAAFFSIATKPREYHFGGVMDLRMKAVSIKG
ncbi:MULTISPECIES: ABC transporter ATP-binding protein [unclassified Pseudomonas]|uniref:ABC transporter ATP-binding protein n=1 Tax=unclassified Pseudomonas TaxID=196821 RepID=UPI001F476F4B|nr:MULTISPECIES: ABC transporter ATP-binding protein [unclassified Pseudomonas]MCF5233276.1 ATP-binding cassette domain-containing protein [Pseudomonas sp. PA-5-4H]MCF5236086.1 ATP-binding cassette domain-containing protein [Pseudomonas sp. PA-5-4G]MCF5250254.1 ATP-binding cassette domain-containing protein [Pseudomonas sp. PA-5-4B]MCF5256534.1 ATP-binding cassette domain-containing protein [Pseudomonas sp. PA-5-4B]MCF5262970.1 ATP-binding cassette domain-containing protein [Pseudomonas sp. PA